MRKTLLSCVFALIAVLFVFTSVSCSEYVPQSKEDNWTVMFYMDMANLNALSDIDELIGGVKTPRNLNLFFITGGCSKDNYYNPYRKSGEYFVFPNLVKALENGGDTTHSLSFYTSTVANQYQYWHYLVNEEGLGAFVPQSHTPTKGMNDGWVLSDFIDWCYSATKEQNTKYLLFLWNHGGGSLRGMMRDDSIDEKPLMTMQDMHDSIKNSKFYKDGNVFDIVAFDMCVMQQIENMNLVRDYAKCMAGSENSAYASAYGSFFSYLNDNPRSTYRNAAMEYCKSACEKQSGSSIITWSAVDLVNEEKLKSLCNEFDLFMKTVKSEADTDPHSPYKDFRAALNDEGIVYDDCSHDICYVASKYGYERIAELKKALNDVLIFNGYGSDVAWTTGLAFFFDPNIRTSFSKYPDYNNYLKRIEKYCPNHRAMLEDYVSRAVL